MSACVALCVWLQMKESRLKFDVMLFLQWLRLTTDARAEQHIHQFSDTFSGRSPAQAEINSTPVPCVCVCV